MPNEKNLRPWKPGESGNPSGKSAQIEKARAKVREFMIDGGGLAEWMALLKTKDPKVRLYVFRDLIRFAFGWAPQEIAVQRTTATLTMGVHAVMDSQQQHELEALRGRIRDVLLDHEPPQPPREVSDGPVSDGPPRGNGQGRSAT